MFRNLFESLFYKQITVDKVGVPVEEMGVDEMGSRQSGNKLGFPLSI